MPDLLAELKTVLSYEPETGHFKWLVYRNSYGGGVTPGDTAGSPKDGYVQIIANQRQYRAHRLAWLFMTGEFPPKGHEVDHANGCRSDNRWANLRLVTRSQNNMNLPIRSNNLSGCTGVSRRADTGKWDARITVGRKVKLLGNFANREDAIAARVKAEHELFGEHSFLKRSA